MKKWFVLLIGLFLTVMIVACSDSNDDASGEPDTSGDNELVEDNGEGATGDQEEITLRIAWWGDQTRHDLTNEVIEMFTEQNPHIKLEPEYASWMIIGND